MYEMITNFDINRIGTLSATFFSLVHAQLTGYSTGANKVDGKTMIYRSGSDFFTVADKLQKALSFSSYLLPWL